MFPFPPLSALRDSTCFPSVGWEGLSTKGRMYGKVEMTVLKFPCCSFLLLVFKLSPLLVIGLYLVAVVESWGKDRKGNGCTSGLVVLNPARKASKDCSKGQVSS